jgi:hypothetical protein
MTNIQAHDLCAMMTAKLNAPTIGAGAVIACKRQPQSGRAQLYKLANEGHDTRAIQAFLGHRNIQNCVWKTQSW